MLSGSALLRVFLLLVAAAVLAGAVQHYLPQDRASEASTLPAPSSVMVKRPAPTNPAESEHVSEATKPPPTMPAPAAPAVEPPPVRRAAIEPRPVPEAPQTAASTEPAATPEPAPAKPEAPQAAIAPQEPADGADGEAAADATENSDPRAVNLVDLNTGSLTELNGLRGGGAIGRAIMQRRPYASIDQLLSKRVLSRSVYQRIKDQVTVR